MDGILQIYDANGNRLYLTPNERDAFLEAAKDAEREVRTFCSVLYYTGCRLSEALELIPARIDFEGKAIIFRSLKKRGKIIHRAVPVPSEVLDTLDMVHGIREALKRKKNDVLETPLWPWSRATGWRRIKEVMDQAGIKDGPHKSPKGLRHGYGVNAISKQVPLNMLQKWMGHAKMETTAIYANALGDEQIKIAAQMWK